MSQEEPAARLEPHVLLMEKLVVSLRVMELIDKVAFPVLLTVKVWLVEDEPTLTLPKFLELGLTLIFGCKRVHVW